MARAARSHRASLTPAAPLLLAAAVLVAACSSAPRQPKEVVEQKNRAADYTDYGNRAFTQGDNRGALTFFQQALAINLSVDNETGVVQSLSSIGKVHAALGELDQAQEVFTRASRLATTLGNPPLQVQTWRSSTMPSPSRRRSSGSSTRRRGTSRRPSRSTAS
jgi:tetratricopeptide (TPR) repeat protein